MVRRVVQGYHSTIFAYGQTGSGKTFNMEGYKYVQNEKGVIVPRVSESTSETWGLVQRCARVMVDETERAKKHRHITMSVSFLEIYNEHIYDLLNSALFRRKQTKSPQPGDPLLITIPFNSA